MIECINHELIKELATMKNSGAKTNPSIYLSMALVITSPFNIATGIPLLLIVQHG